MQHFTFHPTMSMRLQFSRTLVRIVLVCVKPYPTVVINCISHLYVFFTEIPIPIPCCPFLYGLYILLLLQCKSSFYILDISPLPDIQFANISHSVGCPFAFLKVFFEVHF